VGIPGDSHPNPVAMEPGHHPLQESVPWDTKKGRARADNKNKWDEWPVYRVIWHKEGKMLPRNHCGLLA
jgi:hypothetical protein